jgi:hypothetical protein
LIKQWDDFRRILEKFLKTSIGSDFVIPDENLLEILQVDDISQENIFSYLILENKISLCK